MHRVTIDIDLHNAETLDLANVVALGLDGRLPPDSHVVSITVAHLDGPGYPGGDGS